MKVFFDNSVISRMVDKKWKSLEYELAVYKLWNNIDKHNKMTSGKIKEEMLATSNKEKREKLLRLYSQMSLVPTRITVSVSGSIYSQDADRTILRKVFYFEPKGKVRAEGTNDGDHIYEAKEAGCNFFLTLDERLARRYKENLKILRPVLNKTSIVLPDELVW